MESCTVALGNKSFETQVDKYRVITDQPVKAGGEEKGPSAPQLLLVSLGACAAHYAMEYLRARSLPIDDLRVHVYAEKLPSPTRLGNFRVVVETALIDEKHKPGLIAAVKSCLIHRTLTSAPEIAIELGTAKRELALRGCQSLAIAE